MNKKFSTLVAALLVSGVSYAVVSQMDGAAVANGVQTTVVADLRANTLPIEQQALTFEKGAATGAFTAASKWQIVSVKTSKFALATKDASAATAYLKVDGTLTSDPAESAEISVKELYTSGKMALQVTPTGGSVAAFLVVDAEGKFQTRTAVADFIAGDKPLCLYTAEGTAVGVAITAVSTADHVLAQDLNAWETATAKVATMTLGEGKIAYALTTNEVKADAADATAIFTIDSKGGNSYLKTVNGEYYKVADGKLTTTEVMDDASVIGFNSNALTLGGTKIYATAAGELTLDAAGNTGVYVYGVTAGDNYLGAQLVNTTNLPSQAYLLQTNAVDPTAGEKAIVPSVVYTPTLGEGALANVYGQVDAAAKAMHTFTAATTTLKLTAGGIDYLLKEDATTHELSLDEAGTLALKVGTNGELQTNTGNYPIYLKGGKYYASTTTTVPAGGVQVYVYEVETNGNVKSVPEKAALDAKTVVLTTEQYAIPTTINNLSIVNYDLSAAQGALMNLENGAGYKISYTAAGDFLSMKVTDATMDEPISKKKYELANASTFAGEQPKSVWTVAKRTNVNGSNTYYSFTNAETGKPLAFKIEKNDAGDGFNAPAFAIDGKYNYFFVDEQGRISFIANEEAKSDVDGTKIVDKKKYSLKFEAGTWSVEEYDADAQQLNFDKTIVKNVELDANWLNVTAGSGKGFDFLFKGEDGKAISVEANDLSAQSVTAVYGPALDMFDGTLNSESRSTLTDQMFLMVEGEYKGMVNFTGWSDAEIKNYKNDQFNKFRDSKFIIVDDQVYSEMIGDEAANNFHHFTIVKGSDLLSKTGYTAAQAEDNAALTADAQKAAAEQQFAGLTRRIENAIFTATHKSAATINDPIEVSVEARIKKDATYSKISNEGVKDAATLYVAVKKFNNKYYVGAYNTPYAYVYAGTDNNVDYTKVNGIVNIYYYSSNPKNTYNGKMLANDGNGYSLAWLNAKSVNAAAPEGQFLVNYANGKFTFTNRESENEYSTVALKTVAGADGKLIENLYAVVGYGDTLKIVSAMPKSIYDGYKNYDEKAYQLSDKTYNFAYAPSIEGLDSVYVSENHSDTKGHKLALTAEKLDATKFKLVKVTGQDTVKVSLGEYTNAKGIQVADSAVALTYAIYNKENKEFVGYNPTASDLFFYCNPNQKYTSDADAKYAPRFILKEKGDNNYQLIQVSADKNKYTMDAVDGKAYAAFQSEKVTREANIYKIVDNDIVTIIDADAPLYRSIAAAPFDTIRIFKEGMNNVALFAETAKPEIVSGENFLGMTHKAEKDLNKTMFSMFVDTAYVNRDTNKPQYMLVLDADTIHGKYTCNDPSHEPHISAKIDTVYGKYLIAMDDSVKMWKEAGKHNNPYEWEEYPRLAFVNAKHYGDSLVILRDNGVQTHRDTINLKNNVDAQGVFAFRIVDQETKSFKMETGLYRNDKDEYATGWIKWLNGTPVVVRNIEQAEVFNFEATSNNPTSNDAITTSEVSVIASTGSVIVKGAAGKKVAISNILGQTIANTVLTSDNATIAVPAGIVVVAVEGEETAKVVVR